MTFTEVSSPYWSDKTVYIVAGGPSLEGFDFSKLKGGIIIGVNNSAFKCNADVMFSIDKVWMGHMIYRIREFKGEKIFAVPPNYEFRRALSYDPTAQYLIKRRGDGMSEDPRDICATNSGFGALNLAYLKKAKRIIMLGFDMQVPNHKTHWHGGYSWQTSQQTSLYAGWLKDFDKAAIQFTRAGTIVYNAGAGTSLITAFPMLELGSFDDREE